MAASPRNVVLIVLDTVRKDYFDVYAPRIRSRSDASFSQCRSASSWSVPSHASMFTGQLPHEHGIHADSFNIDTTYSDLVERTFLNRLDDHATIGISANPYANSTYGFDELFDEFTDHVTHESLFPSGLSPYMFSDKDTDRRVSTALDLIRECSSHEQPLKSLLNVFWNSFGIDTSGSPLPALTDDGAAATTQKAKQYAHKSDEPIFMFLNYMDAHSPLQNNVRYDQNLHNVPNSWSSNEFHNWELNKDNQGSESYTRNYRALFGAAIDYLDRTVDQLIDSIQDQTERETTFIITSDHGHNLGYPADDGLFHHTGSMSEGIIHVPLEIVNPPDGYPDQIDQVISHLSLGDLIYLCAHDGPFDEITFPDEVPAETIGLAATGDPRNYRDFSDSEFEFWDRLIRCVYDGVDKYEWDSTGGQYLYRLDPDRPSWQPAAEGVADFEFEAKHFSVPAAEYKRQVSSEEYATIDSTAADRLRELGYL